MDLRGWKEYQMPVIQAMRLFVLGVLLLTSGCSTFNFTAYEGRQDQWKTGSSAFVQRDNGPLPVYIGYPPRPYDVLGFVTASGQQMAYKDIVTQAGIRAKRLGADAFIYYDEKRDFAGTVTSGSSFGTYTGNANYYAPGIVNYSGFSSSSGFSVSTPTFVNQISLVAIKWKDSTKPSVATR